MQPLKELSARSAFFLTPQGIRLAQEFADGGAAPNTAACHLQGESRKATVPVWHEGLRCLFWDGKLVKRLRVTAEVQSAILTAFEKLNWPPAIPNPLSDRGDCLAERRLLDALGKLNSRQLHDRLRFHANGAHGVFWEVISSNGHEKLMQFS